MLAFASKTSCRGVLRTSTFVPVTRQVSISHFCDPSLRLVEFTFERFLQAKDSWDDAVQRSIDKSIFLTWEWLSTWWRFLGKERQFLLLTLTDGGKIHAAAPLMSSVHNLFGLRLRKIEFIGNPQSDYQSFLLTEGHTDEVEMIVEYICHRVPNWDLIELRDIPEASETARALAAYSGKSLKFEHRVAERCPIVRLPANRQDFLESLDSRFRKNLRWRQRRLERDFAVDFKVVSSLENVSDAMEMFIDLHQKRRASMKPPGIFSDSRLRRLHLDVASSFARRGWLALGILMVNGDAVAAQYNFKYANKMYCYLSGFDPEYSKYGVGSLLDLYLMEYCMSNGIYEYDFGRGDEPYKRQWQSTPRGSLQFVASRKGTVPAVVKWIMRNARLTGPFLQFVSRGIRRDGSGS
jgi:CelD/BcsL family acetyltransferase involved in cellulose biosynthesis